MTLKEATKSIKPASQALRRQARRHWDQAVKPLGSLGILEEDVMCIVATSGSLAVSLRPRAIVVMYGDDSIVKEDVTQTRQEVTITVAGNMAQGSSCVCLMARQVGADVIPVDTGMTCRDVVPSMMDWEVTHGTKDFPEVPAVAREETVKAIETGVGIAAELREGGCVLIDPGEMGIGNTVTSNALLSVLLDMDPGRVTGQGAGPTTVDYNRKVQVIGKGVRVHEPSGEDTVDALSKVGGLDLTALTGFYIGCAVCDLSVVLGGPITGAATLVAVRVSPDVKEYLLASHVSAEPAGAMALDALGLKPAISMGMRLRGGTGVAAPLPLSDTMASVYTRISSFDKIHVDAYKYLV